MLEVSPSRLELAVWSRGEVVQARVKQASEPDWGGTWPDWVATLASTLAAWTAELGLTGRSVTVVYHSPTVAAGVFTCPTSAGESRAQDAAELALFAMAGIDAAAGPHSSEPLYTDRVAAPANAQNTALLPQRHTLAAADREATLRSLNELATRGGLAPDRFVPAAALGLAAAVGSVCASPSCVCELWVGDHSAVLAVGDRSRLRFVRLLNLGVETFVDALVRAGRVRLPDGSIRAVDRAGARELLFSTGAPAPADSTGGSAEGVPLVSVLTPVIQRFATEVKQSLRFGLTEDERRTVQLTISGPGAGIQGLRGALAAATGYSSSGDASPASDGLSSSGGALALAASGLAGRINLAPADLARRITLTRSRRAVWAGVGACALMVTAQAWWAREELHHVSSDTAISLSASEAAERQNALRIMAVSALSAKRSFDDRLRNQVGTGADWDAMLVQLAREATATIRLTAIDCTLGSSGPTMTITGLASPAPGEPATPDRLAEQVRAFAQRLGALPAVLTVRQGSTDRIATVTGDGLTFSMTLELVSVPAQRLSVVAPEATK